jgi:uncharacterized protein (DUF58 family)
MMIRRLRSWWNHRSAPDTQPIRLGLRRIYVLPTRSGLAYGVCVMLTLIGSINYGLSLGYLLTFVLTASGIVAIVQTCRNLAGLTIRTMPLQPVFAGEHARLLVELGTDTPGLRPGLVLMRASALTVVDIGGEDQALQAHVEIPVATARRGWMPIGRLVLETRFPLGLFRAWAVARPADRLLVYPRPEPSALPVTVGTGDAAPADRRRDDLEELTDLRPYRPGDKPSHIVWKSLARNELPWTRLWDSPGAMTSHWLDESSLPAGLGLEERVSRLAGWVIELNRRGEAFGLRLGGRCIDPGKGPGHRDRCLQLLAEHDGP